MRRRRVATPLTRSTEEMRERVKVLASYGMTRADICMVAGIGDGHFKENFDEAYLTGRADGKTKVAAALMKTALNEESKQAVIAQIFFLKCQGGWSETQTHRFSSEDGKPLAPVINLTIGKTS